LTGIAASAAMPETPEFKVNFRKILLLAPLFFYAAGAHAQDRGDISVKATLKNLMGAYNEESNLRERYLAQAEKAALEGYGPVASLFRAAAKAEQVHVRYYEEVIRQYGGIARAKIEIPILVKHTDENLRENVQRDLRARDKAFSGWIDQAKKEGNKPLAASLKQMYNAEVNHVMFFRKALAELKKWKGVKKDFYVCSVCGNIEESLDDMKDCPVCGAPKTKYSSVI
jgi:rubrerythrin